MNIFRRRSPAEVHERLIMALAHRAPPAEAWKQILRPDVDGGGLQEMWHVPEVPAAWNPLALYASLYSPFDLWSHGRLTCCRIATRALEVAPTHDDAVLFQQIASSDEWKKAHEHREVAVPSSIGELPVRMLEAALKHDIEMGLGNMMRNLSAAGLEGIMSSELNGPFEESVADAAGYVQMKVGEATLGAWCEQDYVDHLNGARNGNEQACILLTLELERRVRPPMRRGSEVLLPLLLQLREKSRVFSGLDTLMG